MGIVSCTKKAIVKGKGSKPQSDYLTTTELTRHRSRKRASLRNVEIVYPMTRRTSTQGLKRKNYCITSATVLAVVYIF
jgi:hypothetical protein